MDKMTGPFVLVKRVSVKMEKIGQEEYPTHMAAIKAAHDLIKAIGENAGPVWILPLVDGKPLDINYGVPAGHIMTGVEWRSRQNVPTCCYVQGVRR